MTRFFYSEKCDVCGRFINLATPGTSYAQTWSFDMGGEPNLHDPHFRCAMCTQEHGMAETNCAHPERYHGYVTAPIPLPIGYVKPKGNAS